MVNLKEKKCKKKFGKKDVKMFTYLIQFVHQHFAFFSFYMEMRRTNQKIIRHLIIIDVQGTED